MLAAAMALMTAVSACTVPLQPIAITVVPLDGAALGGVADPEAPSRYRVGEFVYAGNGIVETSADPRFAELVLDQRFGLRHACGNAVYGPSGWNARDADLSRWTMTITFQSRSSEVSRGSTAAGERGALPVVAGYRLGATWPVFERGGTFFLALMHPENGRRETLIVAFADVPRASPGVVVARLPIVFETLSALPDLHMPLYHVSLGAFREGKLTDVQLQIADTDLATIGARLAVASTR